MNSKTNPTFRQLAHFMRMVEDGLIDVDVFQAFLEKPDQFVKPKFPVVVSYKQSLPEMIAAGGYNYKNDDIKPKNFPIVGQGEVPIDLYLFCFDEPIQSEAARERIRDQGYEVSPIEHLLAFGAKYCDLQRKFPVVALSSVWVGSDGDRRVACLGGVSGERNLYLGWESRDWGGHVRFLAFRK